MAYKLTKSRSFDWNNRGSYRAGLLLYLRIRQDKETEIRVYIEIHVVDVWFAEVSRGHETARRPRVFRLCLENVPDVVVPWPVHPRRTGADLNSER